MSEVREEVDTRRWCKCGHVPGDHRYDGFYKQCTVCPCDMFEEDTHRSQPAPAGLDDGDAKKLELLADWFDSCHPSKETEVQDDLRRIAAALRQRPVAVTAGMMREALPTLRYTEVGFEIAADRLNALLATAPDRDREDGALRELLDDALDIINRDHGNDYEPYKQLCRKLGAIKEAADAD